MKAAVATAFGPPEVVRIQEINKPTPNDKEVLVKILATTVAAGDWRVRSLELPPGFGVFAHLAFGFSKPRQPILGTEFSGVVEAIGKDVKRFKVGDEVFGMSGMKMGCHAEYKTIHESGAIVPKPSNLSFEEAAALSFGGTTALTFFRRSKLKAGESILINGASGCVGSAAIQLAKNLGAQVTAVCSTSNVDMVRSLGADHVIDYTKSNFTQTDVRYDAVMDTVGNISYSQAKQILKPGGRFLSVAGGITDLLIGPFAQLSGKKIIAGPAEENTSDLIHLAELASAGKFKPWIDRRYSLDQIVDAHRYVDQRRKRGSVVITVAG